MRKNNNPAPGKRSMLIDAILNNDKEKLQAFSGNNDKRVVALDTFLDALIWSGNGGFEDPSITFICTDKYEQMWEELESNANQE
jgi:hypothetical protein